MWIIINFVLFIVNGMFAIRSYDMQDYKSSMFSSFVSGINFMAAIACFLIDQLPK